MTNEVYQVQAVVIGAGVVGLAIARSLAIAGQEVLLLEAGPRFGEGISSRNSEVIHGGLYYPDGSLKAELCVKGRDALYEFCEQRHLPHRRCGKWIVAQQREAERLASIRDQASRNGVELAWIDGQALRTRVPDVQAEVALFSPVTGVVDSHALMLALLGELEDAGGQLICQAPVERVVASGENHLLEVGGQSPCWLRATRVVNSAGLGAIALAQRWENMPAEHVPTQFLARGVYFSYSGRHPFESLIYPIPEPGGLGIHLTLDLAGQARFGPDVEWIDSVDYSVDPARAADFAASIQRWWPGLDASRLQPAYAGIRPKIHGPDQKAADFQILGPADHGLEGTVQLFGIESPGLTASLAIAERVVELLAD